MAKKGGEAQHFYEECIKNLYSYWNHIKEANLNQDYLPELRDTISSILHCNDKSYRYVLPTQLIAKLTNNNLDSTCIQDTRISGIGNFNARDVCKYVIVDWERKEGIRIGQSVDPYVNNPLRVPEFTAMYRGNRKDVDTWDLLCEIFSLVEQKNEPDFNENLFKQVLIELRRIQEASRVNYIVPMRLSLNTTMGVLESFLNTRSGGSHLQIVIVALFRIFKSEWEIYDEVVSAPINVPDAPGGRPADIDCRKDGHTVLAVEVKDMTLTLQLLEDKIRSCRENAVTELMFLIRANPLISEGVNERIQKEFASGQNIYIIEALKFIETAVTLLGEPSRRKFIITIGEVAEELRLDFAGRKQWEEILAAL